MVINVVNSRRCALPCLCADRRLCLITEALPTILARVVQQPVHDQSLIPFLNMSTRTVSRHCAALVSSAHITSNDVIYTERTPRAFRIPAAHISMLGPFEN